MYKILTPNKNFTGVRFGLSFIDGVALTSKKEHAIDAEARGYKVIQGTKAELTGEKEAADDEKEEKTD